MRSKEIAGLVVKILSLIDMRISDEALKDIRRISRGLPHYAHLLGLHAGRVALTQHTLCVEREHVSSSIRTAIEKTQASIQGDYRRAIASNRADAQYREVLLACAMTPTDEFGYFAARDVAEPLSYIKRKESKVEAFSRHLHAFADEERGPVLRKELIAAGGSRYRFSNPLLQPYVLLRGVHDGLITEDDLSRTTLAGESSPDVSDDQLELFD
jgi:hypothetical protein